MDYTIRKSKIEDKEAINKAHVLSIREVCSKDYTSEQIAGWSALVYSDDIWKKNVAHDHHLVIVVDNSIQGFCHSKLHPENLGEIMGLYLTPMMIGIGAGRKIFGESLEFLIQGGAKKIHIDATRTAKGFYQKMGFSISGVEQLHETRGIAFEYIPMDMLV
ncbi:MAG: GNAT family N-acetyltransferase [Bacteriovoracaceae bacterium]|jgi:putative acetyltransferase|nr:GNAT family N-acetyltransferase [Bacteriovoracaceae bacterium]